MLYCVNYPLLKKLVYHNSGIFRKRMDGGRFDKLEMRHGIVAKGQDLDLINHK